VATDPRVFLAQDAAAAYQAGRQVHVVILGTGFIPVTSTSQPHLADEIMAVEQAGWHLEQMSVYEPWLGRTAVAATGSTLKAVCVFRRRG